MTNLSHGGGGAGKTFLCFQTLVNAFQAAFKILQGVFKVCAQIRPCFFRA